MKNVIKIVEQYLEYCEVKNISKITNVDEIKKGVYRVTVEEQDFYGVNVYQYNVKNGKLYDAQWRDVYNDPFYAE